MKEKKEMLHKCKHKTKKELQFEPLCEYQTFILKDNEYSRNFYNWFNNVFKNQYPGCYIEYSVEKDQKLNEFKTIEIYSYNAGLRAEVLMYLFDDYMDQKHKN